MKFYYLYCVSKLDKGLNNFDITGFGGENVSVLPYKDIGAVVSPVSSSEFNSKTIKDKIQNIKWIEPRVRNHERAVEGVMNYRSAVIPMRFGTVYRSPKKIEDTLRANYGKFTKALKKVENAGEWGVKVYLNGGRLGDFIQNRDKKIGRLIRDLGKSKSEGEKFFLRKRVDNAVREKMRQETLNYLVDIFDNFKKHAREALTARILPKELTKKDEDMILNAVYLVDKARLPDFKKAAKDISSGLKQPGLILEISGPWPAYHFV